MVAAFVGGAGLEVFGLGWNLAMQEHVPDEMLSRAYSYDSLGSFVAIPVGQLAAGPVAALLGVRETILAAGVAYFALCLATLGSRSVRDLQRARRGHVIVIGLPFDTRLQSTLANCVGSIVWLAVTQSMSSCRISTCWL